MFQDKDVVDLQIKRFKELMFKLYEEYALDGGLDFDNGDTCYYFSKIFELFDTVEHINENKYILDHLEYDSPRSTGDLFYGLVPLLFDKCKDYRAKAALLALVNTTRFRSLCHNENSFNQDIEYWKHIIESEKSKNQ
jgi:hypothetical protein